MGPRGLDPGRRKRLLRRHREIDDLLALQLAEQAGNLVLRHRLVAELQAEHAALYAIDDRGVIVVEQRVDVRDFASGAKRTSARGGATSPARLRVSDGSFIG